MQFEGQPVNQNVWESVNFTDSQGVVHQLIQPRNLQLVMTSIQMKWEHLRILYEAKINRRPSGILFEGKVCFDQEMGLHDMRLYYLQQCENEQELALESYNLTFVQLFNTIQSEISLSRNVGARVTHAKLLIQAFMHRFLFKKW